MVDDKPLSLLNRIRAFFVCMGGIGAGAIILWAPGEMGQEMRAEMSDTLRVLIGSWFAAVGVVVGLVGVFGSSADRGRLQVAARFRGLALVLFALPMLCILLGTFGQGVYDLWRLHQSGQATQAVVMDARVRFSAKRMNRDYLISYDGHRAKVRLPTTLQRGSTLMVLYLPDEPAVVTPGTREDTLLDLVDRTWGIWPALGYAGIMLALAACIPFGLWHFVMGKRIAAAADTG